MPENREGERGRALQEEVRSIVKEFRLRAMSMCKDNFSTRSDTRTEVYIVLHSTLYVWN